MLNRPPNFTHPNTHPTGSPHHAPEEEDGHGQKLHSERGHTSSHPHTHTQTSNPHPADDDDSVPTSTSPPPSAPCAHWQQLNINAIRQRFRAQTFQKNFHDDHLACLACEIQYPKEHLWACLQCDGNLEAQRCGRYKEKHSLHHFKTTGHCLAIHLSSRVIWCYSCDNELSDDWGNDSSKLTPQTIRQALDMEDAAPPTDERSKPSKSHHHHHQTNKQQTDHTEDGHDDSDSDSIDNDEEEEEELNYKHYYTNKDGGQVGLKNLGNTCFLNAGLQAVLHCPQLVAFFSEVDPHLPDDTPRQKLAHHFGVLTRKVWSGDYRVCAPVDIVRDIVTLNPFFRGYGQHDSQEFIRCFLDNLHEAIKLVIEYQYDIKLRDKEMKQEAEEKAKALKEEEENKKNGENDEKKEKPKPAPKKRYPEASVVADLFQGFLQSQIKCSNCHNVSITQDPFYDLSLEMPKDQQLKKIGQERGQEALTPQGKVSWFTAFCNYTGLTQPQLSVETCLHSFCTSDRLLHADQYKCDKCKQRVDATKSLAIHALPEILCLHIKRFAHNTYFGQKIGRHVMFPLRNLDMTPFLTKDSSSSSSSSSKSSSSHASKDEKKREYSSLHGSGDGENRYDLFAIVRHLGSVSGGHYIAYAKSHVTDKWYEFDDSIVTEISEEKVSKVEAYVLFYKRRHDKVSLNHALDLVNKCIEKSSQSKKTPKDKLAARFISKHWMKKMEILGRPEPIDNRNLCCPHGVPKALPANGGDLAVAISDAEWQTLLRQFGGGPLVDGQQHDCETCLLPVIREKEKARVYEADRQATTSCGPDDPFYFVHAGWLNSWREYVAGKANRPTPVTNDLLFERDGKTLKADMKRGEDFRAIRKIVWDTLIDIYGGGPAVIRKSVDIYASDEEVARRKAEEEAARRKEEEQETANSADDEQDVDEQHEEHDDDSEADPEEVDVANGGNRSSYAYVDSKQVEKGDSDEEGPYPKKPFKS